jgi:hypothetical protein
MERNGYTEDTWFTWSYSPIPDDAGGIGGVFCACTEETQRVLAERERDRIAGELAEARARMESTLSAAEVGTWTCPGDYGGKAGLLTPAWWPLDRTTEMFWKLVGAAEPNSSIGYPKSSELIVMPEYTSVSAM